MRELFVVGEIQATMQQDFLQRLDALGAFAALPILAFFFVFFRILRSGVPDLLLSGACAASPRSNFSSIFLSSRKPCFHRRSVPRLLCQPLHRNRNRK